MDKVLGELETRIHGLVEGTKQIRTLITPEHVLVDDMAISQGIDSNMHEADTVRSMLLRFRKDGRADKATMYNEVLNKFVAAVQDFTLLQEQYDALLRHAFSGEEKTLSVKKIGDAHYLVRENTLLRFGFGELRRRDEKLSSLHTTTTQLKAMLVGLEFLVLSGESSIT